MSNVKGNLGATVLLGVSFDVKKSFRDWSKTSPADRNPKLLK